MPRESIQITGIQVEQLTDGDVRIIVRTPDNASFVVYDDSKSQFIGAQKMLTLKREYQKAITDARV